MHFFIRTIL